MSYQYHLVGTIESPNRPELLHQVRNAIRFSYYSTRAKAALASWIRRYICFHDVRLLAGRLDHVSSFTRAHSRAANSRARAAMASVSRVRS